MAKVWKIGSHATAAIEVECAAIGYPHHDADGEIAYSNTHFADEDTAWIKLGDERRAHHQLAASAVREARAALAKKDAHLLDAALPSRSTSSWRERQEHARDAARGHA